MPLRTRLASARRAAVRISSKLGEAFRRELLRVLNRGEAVNALKRSIYVGRVSTYQAKQHEEMQAVADALSLLANLVMAWNTMKMQSVLDHWNARRSTAVPPALIGLSHRLVPRGSICAVCSPSRSSNIGINCYRHFREQNHGPLPPK